MKKTRFIAIKNQSDSNTLDLYFLDEIKDSYDFWSDNISSKVQEIIDKVNYYQPSKIKCIIDSIGGDAFVGIAIYNFLKHTTAKVEVEIIGLAGSIASVVAMAANKGKLRIAKNAFMMIHKAEGVTGGTAEQIIQGAAVVAKFDDQIADIYSQRTGRSIDDIRSLYATGDYWMTGDEAVAQGFADEIFNEAVNIEVAARLSTENYKNIPAAIKAKMKPGNQENNSFFQTQLDDMKKFFTEVINQIRGVKPSTDATITNQIADAIQTPFEKLGDEIESTITNKVNDAVKADDFKTLITNAVKAEMKVEIENATKPLTEKITALETAKTELEKKNVELEQEITNKLGGASSSKNQKDAPEPIGTFA